MAASDMLLMDINIKSAPIKQEPIVLDADTVELLEGQPAEMFFKDKKGVYVTELHDRKDI